MEIKQSTSARSLVFYMVDSTDHVTGKTGLAPTVLISKDGGSFASPIGAEAEIGYGFYKVAGHASDSNTLGLLALTASATGADRCAVPYWVVANLESDSMGAIAAIPADLTASFNGVVDVIDTHFSEHTAEFARLDVAVGTRLATAGYTAPNNPADAAIAAAVRAALLTELNRIDVAVSTRLATAGYTAPNNPSDAAIATAVRNAILTELGRLDVAVSTRLASASYTAPNNPTNAAIGDAVRAKLEPEISRLAACATVESTGAQIAAFETA